MSPKGYIYMLTNPSLPNVCKIGKTTRDIDSRLKELYNTSVPTPYQVILLFLVDDCHTLERYIHTKCRSLRVNKKREFFIYNDVHDFSYYQSLFLVCINRFNPTISPYFNSICIC